MEELLKDFECSCFLLVHLIKLILDIAHIYFEFETFLRNSNQFFLSYGCNIIQYIKKKLNKLMLWTLAPTIEYVLTFNTRDTKMSWSAFWVNYISIRIIEKVQLKPDFCRNSSSCLWQTGKLSERKSVFNNHHF